MRQKIITIAFILSVFGLVVLNRFDLRPKESVTVRRDTSSSYSIGHTFKQSEIIHTAKGEFLEISIGSSIMIDLDENTDLSLKSLSQNNVRVSFGHGRILAHVTQSGSSIEVDTPTAQNTLKTPPHPSPSKGEGASATFVGYDFSHMTNIIPLTGTLHTTIPLLNRSFDTKTAINIHDVNPPTIDAIAFNQNTDAVKEFYAWAEEK